MWLQPPDEQRWLRHAGPFRHYDSVHPNTLYMGVVGNQMITNVNAAFGFALDTIPEAQLLDNAGL